MDNATKYAASRAGMKRLQDSKRRASIKAGNRCSKCEAWIYPGYGKSRTCSSCSDEPVLVIEGERRPFGSQVHGPGGEVRDHGVGCVWTCDCGLGQYK